MIPYAPVSKTVFRKMLFVYVFFSVHLINKEHFAETDPKPNGLTQP